MKHAEWGHTHGMWEVNGLLFLSGVRRVTDRSISEHSGLSFLIRTLEGVGKHAFARLVYSGVWYSELSIWVVWGGWGPELVRLLGVGSWVRGCGYTSMYGVHLPVCGAHGWLVCLHVPQSSILCVHVCVCARVCARELKGVCVCVHVMGVPWSVWAVSGCGGGQWGAALL